MSAARAKGKCRLGLKIIIGVYRAKRRDLIADMSRLLGITQATAWRVGYAIRTMMDDRNGARLSGIVEIDLKYLGGVPKRRKDG